MNPLRPVTSSGESEDEQLTPEFGLTSDLAPIDHQATEFVFKRIEEVTTQNGRAAEGSRVVGYLRQHASSLLLSALHRYISEYDAQSDTVKLREFVLSILPPAGAIFHREIKAPRVFRQRRNIFIDKLTVNIDELAKADEMFWWQPVDVPVISHATSELIKLIDSFNPDVDNFNLGMLRTNIVDPLG